MLVAHQRPCATITKDIPASACGTNGTGLNFHADFATPTRIFEVAGAALASCAGESGLVCPMEAVLRRGQM